jgi:ribosomal protein S18 acetylase RimI-like enzyme
MGGYIRLIDLDDIPRLLELEQLFENSMAEPVLARELEVGSGFAFVGNMNPWILGYALIREDGDLIDLTRLAVDPVEQGVGVGTLLLKHVLSLCCDTMLTVRKANHKAIRLYLKHGFAVVGHISAADAWVLRRPSGLVKRPEGG